MAQIVKNLPSRQETLGWEDSLEKAMAILQYSCLENSLDRGASGLQSMGSQGVRHD